MRLFSFLLALLICAAPVRAATPTIDFDGSTYMLAYEDHGEQTESEPGNALAEFTLPGETVEDWSKLFAFHSFPTMGDDPVAAVEAVGKVVKETNKDANFAIVENEETGEAIIDFLTWAPESDVMEFNVFKYAPAADGRGLVAMQYAQHIKLGDMTVDEMRELRARTVEDMSRTDIRAAQDYFKQLNGKAASNDAGDNSSIARSGSND